MRLLVVTPDYASHYLPLGAVAARAGASGMEVVVATGPGLRPRIEQDGHRHAELRMSVGSNAGVRSTTQAGDDLRPFFAATELGMVPTLRHQAEARRHDLLWQPRQVAEDTRRLVERVGPDVVLVDHLCLAARLGLYAGEVPTVTFVPGHPTQVPVAGEVYGYPVGWPTWVRPDDGELDALWRCCREVGDALTAEAAAVVQALAPGRPPIDDVFGAHGAIVLYNSPAALHDPARHGLPGPHHFLGSCVRAATTLDADVSDWLDRGDPFDFVSLGTFLSARTDVLRRLVGALAAAGRRVAMAIGSTDRERLGTVPRDWLVRPFLPQVELIAEADVVICHGGNNTVTESLTAGRPLLVLPLSTDQFCIAADVERAGVGVSADPNRSSVEELTERLAALDHPSVRKAARKVGIELNRTDGADVAVDVLDGVRPRRPASSGGSGRLPGGQDVPLHQKETP